MEEEYMMSWKGEFTGRALTSDAGYEFLRYQCEEIGPRMAGTAAEVRARDWICQQLEGMGYQVTVEPFAYPQWLPGEVSLEVLAPVRRSIYCLPLGWAGPGEATASLVSAGYGLRADFAATQVSGQIVLVKNGAPAGRPAIHRSEKYALAQSGGAAALVVMREHPLGVVGIGSVGLSGQLGRIPAVSISFEDGSFLNRCLEAGPVTATVKMASASRPGTSWNLRATLPGTALSHEKVVISAHYDSWYICPGAHDNANGVAVMLDLARILRDFQSPRSFEFLAVGVEELGLFGSYHHAAAHRDELAAVTAVLNLDSLCCYQGDKSLLCNGHPALAEFCRRLLAGMLPDVNVNTRINCYSDHFPFFLQGVPAMHFLAWGRDFYSAYNHTAYDTLDKVTPHNIREATLWAGLVGMELAQNPDLPFGHLTLDEVKRAVDAQDLRSGLELAGRYPK
jgi:Iap family predicted aminopeptidase